MPALARAGDGGNVAFEAMLADGRGPYAARLGWTSDADGMREAYVLSLTVPGATTHAAAAPRPEFYDFDLARLKPAGGALGTRRLSALSYVVFDLETTGLDTANDEIVSVGAVRVLGTRILGGESHTTLVDPGRPIPPASTVFHGIDDKAVAGAPGPAEAARAFKLFVHDAVLVAHNAAFDLAFLHRAAAAAGIAIDNPAVRHADDRAVAFSGSRRPQSRRTCAPDGHRDRAGAIRHSTTRARQPRYSCGCSISASGAESKATTRSSRHRTWRWRYRPRRGASAQQAAGEIRARARQEPVDCLKRPDKPRALGLRHLGGPHEGIGRTPGPHVGKLAA